MEKKRQLLDEYRFPGFRPRAYVYGVFGDPKARVIQLERTQKKQTVDVVGKYTEAITTGRFGGYEICRVEMHGYTWKWKSGEYHARGAGK
jgi:hypothetical protein